MAPPGLEVPRAAARWRHQSLRRQQMLTQSRRTLDKVYRTETTAYSVGNYLSKDLHQKSDDISVLLLVIKREVAAFPRYSLNFEATGAREAEEE